MTRLLSELPFGSFLAYSPRGSDSSTQHRRALAFRTALKSDGPFLGQSAIDFAVRRLAEIAPPELSDFFGPEVLAVPVPRSAPFPPRTLEVPLRGAAQDFLWVPNRICEQLVAHGLVRGARPLLSRIKRVSRSSTASPHERPRPEEHIQSMSCQRVILDAPRIVVIDDVITRGATLLAAASLLAQSYPGSEILGFGLLRAISNPLEFSTMLAPVRGLIVLREHGDTLRRP